MKVIFLDCDGVINSLNHLKKTYEKRHKLEYWQRHISIELVDNLAKLVNKTKAKIVLSSCWRLGFNEDGTPKQDHENCVKLAELFKERNIQIIGRTDWIYINHSSHRSSEIKDYLDKHNDIEKFIIIDDDIFDILDKEGYTGFYKNDVVVTTSWKYGLTRKKMREGIEKLNKER